VIVKEPIAASARSILIREDEVKWRFIPASGPSGQNKVATAVQLGFDTANSPSLPEDVRGHRLKLAGRRLTNDGVLVIDARRHRTQQKTAKTPILGWSPRSR
jgi:ribosome-associated protein